MNRVTIEPYTPPEIAKYPDDTPILIAGIVGIALVPIVFICAFIWG